MAFYTRIKDPITVRQLLQYLTFEDEHIQISDGSEWEIYSEFQSQSYLLEPYLDWYVMELGIIKKNIIRIVIRQEKSCKGEING